MIKTLFENNTTRRNNRRIVQVPIVTDPTRRCHLILTVFHALRMLAPFMNSGFNLRTSFHPIYLGRLHRTTDIQIVQALCQRHPRISKRAFFRAHFFRRNFHFFEVMNMILGIIIVTPRN